MLLELEGDVVRVAEAPGGEVAVVDDDVYWYLSSLFLCFFLLLFIINIHSTQRPSRMTKTRCSISFFQPPQWPHSPLWLLPKAAQIVDVVWWLLFCMCVRAYVCVRVGLDCFCLEGGD